VDRDQETGFRDRSPSQEELCNNQELEEMTLVYIDSLLSRYRVAH
jgi:hypothetical protein